MASLTARLVPILCACVAAALVIAVWEFARFTRSACQWFRGLLASARPAGRDATALPASQPGGASNGAAGSRPAGPPSNHSRSSSDLSMSYLPFLSLATIVTSEPDVEAFIGGVQTVLYVALATAAALVAITFFRKWFG